MNETERKDVSELTNDELRREIAEALYIVRVDGDDKRLIDPARLQHVGGKILATVSRYTSDWLGAMIRWDDDTGNGNIPNWPADDGAAFRLVISVLDRLNATLPDGVGWYFIADLADVFYGQRQGDLFTETIPDPLYVWGVRRDARALSELTALALRQMGGAG